MVAEHNIELFITESESLILEALAQADAPHSQRAQALLAVDAGSTIEQAARVANLKVTQVRYWIGRFRNGRLGVFPDELIGAMEDSIKAGKKKDAAKKVKKKKTKAKTSPKKSAAAKKDKKKKVKKTADKKDKKVKSTKASKAKKKKGAKKSTKKKK